MRKSTLLSLLAAAALLLAVVRDGTEAQAQTPLVSCFGAPADYVTAFDGVRGQPVDGDVTYPYKTAYIEYQGWLTPNDGVQTPGHHSEHTHHGACLPLGQTLNDSNARPWFVDAKIIGHNIQHYTVSSFAASLITANGSTNAFSASSGQLAAINTAFAASGDMGTETVFQSYTVNLPETFNTANGIKELRWQIQMDRNSPEALVDFWKMNGRSYFTYDYAGRPQGAALGGTAGCKINFVRTQNWIEFHEGGPTGPFKSQYLYAGLQESKMNLDGPCTYPAAFDPAALAQPRPEPWTTTARTTDGANRLSAFVDPNFHVHPDTNAWTQDFGNPATTGVPVDNGFDSPMTIPLDELGLSGGVHRFMVQGHKWPNQVLTQPINTSIVVMPFAQAGGCN